MPCGTALTPALSRRERGKDLNKLPITGITPFTFQDYPEHTACILWFSGCNMKCGYCHNPELARGELRKLPFGKLREFLESRRGLLEGAVLSGGECTLGPQLPGFAAYLKSLGFKVKIDTNGTNPAMLERLLADRLVDFIALDFKAPREKFSSITGFDDYALFERSLCLLCHSGVALEIRTTVHTDLLGEDCVNGIIASLERAGFRGTYAVQNFRPGKTLSGISPPGRAFDASRLARPGFELRLRNF